MSNLLSFLSIASLLITGGNFVSALNCYNIKGELFPGNYVQCGLVVAGSSTACCKEADSGVPGDACDFVGTCKYASGKGTPEDFATVGCTDKDWGFGTCNYICGPLGGKPVKCDDGSHCCDSFENRDSRACCSQKGTSGGGNAGGKNTDPATPAGTPNSSGPKDKNNGSSTGNLPISPEKTETLSGSTPATAAEPSATATSEYPWWAGAGDWSTPAARGTTATKHGTPFESSSASTGHAGDSGIAKTASTVTTVMIGIAVAVTAVGLIACLGLGCFLWRFLQRRRARRNANMSKLTPFNYSGRVELEDAPVPYSQSAIHTPPPSSPWGYQGNQTHSDLRVDTSAQPTPAELDAIRIRAELDSTQRVVSPASVMEYRESKLAYVRTPSPQIVPRPAYAAVQGHPTSGQMEQVVTRRRASGPPVFHEMG